MASPESLSLSELTIQSTQATSHGSVKSASCPFFEVLPLEIRRKIYGYAFEGSIMHIGGRKRRGSCARCGVSVFANKINCSYCQIRLTQPQSPWPNTHDVLLTCSSMYHEARLILAACVEVRLLCSQKEPLAKLLSLTSKYAFLKFAAPYVKHVSANQHLCQYFPTIRGIFPGVQLMGIGSFHAWELDVFGPCEDYQFDAKHVESVRRMAKLCAFELNQSTKDFRDDLHVHFHYHAGLQGSEYRLVYDLTSDMILAEDIELSVESKYGDMWLRQNDRVAAQKWHRQLVSRIQARAMSDDREQRIKIRDCGNYEILSVWVKGVKTADLCEEMLCSP